MVDTKCKKVTCYIGNTFIDDALLYYCSGQKEYFILQNIKSGLTPFNSLTIASKYNYKYSWKISSKSIIMLEVYNVHQFSYYNNNYEVW